MKRFAFACLVLASLCLILSCAPAAPENSNGMKPVELVDMLRSDIIDDQQLQQLQDTVWPANDSRNVITDKAVYDDILAQKPKDARFLTYEALQELGEFVSYASAEGDPAQDGFVCPNYAYTFRDPLLELTWTLYVIEGRPQMPNMNYQPVQDLFYEFDALYKDNYSDDMRTQDIGDAKTIVELRNDRLLYFYQNENGKGACKAVMFENNQRAFLLSGNFSAVDTALDPQHKTLVTRLLFKLSAAEAAKDFMKD